MSQHLLALFTNMILTDNFLIAYLRTGMLHGDDLTTGMLHGDDLTTGMLHGDDHLSLK